MKRYFIDLHTHSTASDGTDNPATLVRRAAAQGLAAVALTDHDCIDGLDEAAAEAARCGIRFIRGIEIAANYDNEEVHLLGLWMPDPSAAMQQALKRMRSNRKERNDRILDALERIGLPVSAEEVCSLSSGGPVGRPHIALAMKNRGYVHNRREAFIRYIGNEGRAFVPRVLMDAEEGIALLRGEGALVALAHPCLYRNMNRQKLDRMLENLAPQGLHALEVYHSSHTQEQVRICVSLADKYGLLLSGGSDYHGRNKANINLGTGLRGNVRVPLYVLEKMEAFRREKGLLL